MHISLNSSTLANIRARMIVHSKGDTSEGKPVESNTCCPVCGHAHRTHEDAADCCLWHDLAPYTRAEVAGAVRNGKTWAEALGIAAC